MDQREPYLVVYTKSEKLVFWSYSETRSDYVAHRLDGPAKEYRNRCKEWWINDKLHRLDSPAVYKDPMQGTQYYINGRNMNGEDHFKVFLRLMDAYPLELQLTDPDPWLRQAFEFNRLVSEVRSNFF